MLRLYPGCKDKHRRLVIGYHASKNNSKNKPFLYSAMISLMRERSHSCSLIFHEPRARPAAYNTMKILIMYRKRNETKFYGRFKLRPRSSENGKVHIFKPLAQC